MDKKITKEQLTNILGMLNMKKALLESCTQDYAIQIKQVEEALKKFEEAKPTESEKS